MSDKFTWMHSGQIGAPQMNGAAGSNGQMLQVLDACLIDGFNPQTVTVVTKTATTVTLTFGVSHGYELSQIIEVSGATDAALNGQHRITHKTDTTITIDAVGVAVTTGTITTKVAPLEWESMFGSADPLKRAYRSLDTTSTQTVLYLDMTLPTGHGYNATNPAKRAMVSICEDMTTLGVQINSYTDLENNYATNPNGTFFWYQARDNSKTTAVNIATNRPWVIAGNGKIFYLFLEWQSYRYTATSKLRDLYVFGDADSLAGAQDNHNCMWIGSNTPNDVGSLYAATTGAGIGGINIDSNPIGFFIKKYDGVGLKQNLVMTSNGLSVAFSTGRSSDPNVIPAPNPTSGSLVCFPLYALTNSGLRAEIPKLNAIPQNLADNVGAYDLSVANGVLVVATSERTRANSINNGFYAVDLRG